MKLVVALTTETIEELKEVIKKIENISGVAWIEEKAETEEEIEMLNKAEQNREAGR